MKMKYLIAASALALMAGNSARAADIIHYQQAFVPAFSWTGFYGGADVGYGFGKAELKSKAGKSGGGDKDGGGSKDKPSTYSDVSTAKDKKKKNKKDMKTSGAIGGFYAGYNYGLADRIILGVDTDFTFSDVSKSKKVAGNNIRVRQRWEGATRLRAGYAFHRFLPYVALGIAYSDIKTGIKGPVKKTMGGTRTGFTAGGGVDYALTNHLILRGEYRYSDYGKKNIKMGPEKLKVKYHQNDVRVGVAYKF